mgnify:CR=1 FL=1
MNTKETGKLIAKLRKEAGYTQKSLADALYVTDKAVSKWERGLCLPDTSLLPKLSMLLDADMEHLISGKLPYGSNSEWSGVLIANGIDYDLYDKPVIFYLLSYFMLVGINNIEIRTNNKEYIISLNLEQYGLNIKFNRINSRNVMLVSNKVLVFGVNLTRQLSDAMNKKEDIALCVDNIDLPIYLIKNYNNNTNLVLGNNIAKKNLGRGMVTIPLNTKENIKDAIDFVRIHQKYNEDKIADIEEICKRRGIIK